MALFSLNQYVITYLATVGGINASQTLLIKLQSVAGIDTTKPGVLVVDFADPLDETVCEWITYTSIDVNNELVGAVRGAEKGSAKVHSQNVAIGFPLSEIHINQIVEMFDTTGLDVKEISTPASPVAGRVKIYGKTDDKVYKLTSAGVETEIGTGAGGNSWIMGQVFS